MNEITRIHIAKTAYDIEITAKKQLEKYIKSLESYTQDSDVLTDIEIRITELLAERGVAAGGVISGDDVAAVRAQLGEPYEFAGEGGDIAVGTVDDSTGKRLYRSTDNAVLGGVLSGIAAYFNVNPLWTRLVFVLLLFISFGLAAFAYVLFWILTPAARTATEKLKLAGRDVTLESIKELNADEEKARPSAVAPVLHRVLSIGFGAVFALAALMTLAGAIWMAIGGIASGSVVTIASGYTGIDEGYDWLVWLMFWVVLFGIVLLAALFGLIAYAFFAKKLTKAMIISGIVIIVLGLASVSTVVGVSATQSMRVANETRNLVRDTKMTLPKEFAAVRSVTVSVKNKPTKDGQSTPLSSYARVRYVVDNGPARYEMTALPTTNVVITTEGAVARIKLDIQNTFRNNYVQPLITIYGPALDSIGAEEKTGGADIEYAGAGQKTFGISSKIGVNIQTTGTFEKVAVSGDGSVDLSLSAVQLLTVDAQYGLSVSAGTVRELTVAQPEVCPAGTYQQNTNVVVSGVTSGQMSYNGTVLPAKTHQTSCAIVTVGPEDMNNN
jgi:phage shock protein PspC (stress-responsive transcriptional regulator)